MNLGLKRPKPKIRETERKERVFDISFDFSFDRTILKIIMPDNEVLIFDNELEKTNIFWTDYLSKLHK